MGVRVTTVDRLNTTEINWLIGSFFLFLFLFALLILLWIKLNEKNLTTLHFDVDQRDIERTVKALRSRLRCQIQEDSVRHIYERHGNEVNAIASTKNHKMPSWFNDHRIMEKTIVMTINRPTCSSPIGFNPSRKKLYRQFRQPIGFSGTGYGRSEPKDPYTPADCVCVILDDSIGLVTAYPILLHDIFLPNGKTLRK